MMVTVRVAAVAAAAAAAAAVVAVVAVAVMVVVAAVKAGGERVCVCVWCVAGRPDTYTRRDSSCRHLAQGCE